MNTDPEMINKVYQTLIQKRFELTSAAIILADVTDELKKKEATIISVGVEGKNAEERKANLLILTDLESAAVDKANAELVNAHYEFEVAQDEVSRVRLLMRYDELANKEEAK